MNMRRIEMIAIIGWLGASACGDAGETVKPEEASTGDEVAVIVEIERDTPPPRDQLGHYSTEDSRDGFVLDRTAQPWLLQRDGTSVVIPLFESNRGTEWIEYRGGDVWLRVYTSGWDAGRVLYEGPNQREGVSSRRDADAAPLR